jgi:hypothetical protein
MDYIKDITEIEETTKDRSSHEGYPSMSMALYNHPNFSAQREGGITMQNH